MLYYKRLIKKNALRDVYLHQNDEMNRELTSNYFNSNYSTCYDFFMITLILLISMLRFAKYVKFN